MKINGSIALVTGANRGLGRQFANQLLDRGSAKVYATARRPELVDIPGVDVLRLDITDGASVAAAAAVAADVTLLVNNAGVATRHDLVTGDLDKIRLEMDTNFYGTLAMVRAFAPVLAACGGGAILNVLSAMSWLSFVGANAYGVAKAAEWSLTNGVRLELAGQGTLVSGLYLAAAATDMTKDQDVPKSDPAKVVSLALDGIEAGRLEIIADEQTAAIKAALSADPAATYADQLAAASARSGSGLARWR